jgi:hypothetical protein
MKNGKQVAKRYLELGLNPLPILPDKKSPLNHEHNTVPITEEAIEDYDFDAIGISTGVISGGLEAIDFDLKNASDPEAIMKVFKSKVPKDLLKRLVVQKTQNNGFHFVYRCEDISSSKKLAMNPEGKAIIETRGEGGLIKCYPSEGYEMVQGSFEDIPIITPRERLQIFVSAKMLNQNIKKDARKRASREDLTYFKKFPKYNEDSDVGIKLLEKHGWKVHNEDSEWINMTRPDSASGDIHAGYHKDGKFFFCFSTAQTTFEEEKPYNNHALYAELECDGNYPQAYAKLYEMGFGVDGDKKFSPKKDEKLDWEDQLENLTFLSDEVEENTYLEQARKDEVPLGLSTGWRAVDQHFLLKPNSLNIGLGYDGVGKSVFALNIAVASKTLHNWKWGMVMPENKTGMSRRRIIELMTGKSISDFKESPIMFDKYKQEAREYFHIISNKKHYSIEDVIEMGKKLYHKKGIDALLIDPFNFFKVEGEAYGFNNKILSQLRVFAESYCSVYILAHPSSFAPRNSKGDDGYLTPPNKYSIQGGADFPYRVDDFFVAHRVVNHSDNEVRRTMQFIVEKVKETETGGRVHNQGEYTGMIYERRNGFLGYWDEFGDNPMYKAIISKLGVRAQMKSGVDLPKMSPQDAFGDGDYDEPF